MTAGSIQRSDRGAPFRPLLLAAARLLPGLAVAVLALLAGPRLLAPQAAPEPGPAGELWMRIRLLQILGLLLAGWLLLTLGWPAESGAGEEGSVGAGETDATARRGAATNATGASAQRGVATGVTGGSDAGRRRGASASTGPLNRFPGILRALLPAALFILMGLFFRYGIYDDAYISLRYARNFAHGLGLVYNPNERVEGYTSFLWVIVLGALHRLAGTDLRRLSLIAGICGGLATMVLVAWHLPKTGVRGGRAGQLLVLAVCLPLVLWSFSGMETSVFAALLLLATILLFRVEAQENAATEAREEGRTESPEGHSAKPAFVAGLAFAVAVLARPEALLYAAVALAAVTIWTRPGRRLRSAAGFTVGLLLLVGPEYVFRLAYYGDLLPNTYYTKVDGFSWGLVRYGAGYLLRGLVWESPLVALAILGCAQLPRERRERRRRMFILALILAQFVVILYTGADHFGEMRFFAPIAPLLLILAAPGALWLAGQVPLPFLRTPPGDYADDCPIPLGYDRSTRHAGDRPIPKGYDRSTGHAGDRPIGPANGPRPARQARSWLAGGLLLGAAALSLLISFFYGGVGYDSSLRYGAILAQRWETIGEWLGKEARPGDLLATPVAGAIPYASGLPTLDMQGLTDRKIAHEKVALGGKYKDHEKWDVDYVLSRRPDWIFLGHFGVSSLEDFRRRPKLPVLEALSKRLPLAGYELISGRYHGEEFTFLHRTG